MTPMGRICVAMNASWSVARGKKNSMSRASERKQPSVSKGRIRPLGMVNHGRKDVSRPLATMQDGQHQCGGERDARSNCNFIGIDLRFQISSAA
jgi:hypothetical protein